MRGRSWLVIGGLVLSGLATTIIEACGGPDETADGGPDATSKDAANDTVTNDVVNDTSTDGGCVDGSATDPTNCGSCGHKCTGGAACYSGVCGNEAAELSAGFYSACALMGDHRVWCWGDNTYGEIAANSSGDVSCSGGPCRPVAQQVAVGDGGVKASEVSVGKEFACVVDTAGTVWCWGRNDHGQLGHSPSIDVLDAGGAPFSYTATAVSGLPPVASVSAGLVTACAVTTAGAVWCWGDDTTNELGGADAGAAVSAPTETPTLSANVDRVESALTVSQSHICARKTDGTAWCWTQNFYGERGSEAGSLSPPSQVLDVDGGPLGSISMLATAKYSTCALRPGGTFSCWGQDINDVFGNPNLSTNQTVGPVPTVSDAGSLTFASINGHTIHMCGLTAASDLYCWGDNSYGEIGLGVVIDAGSPTYNTVQKVPSFAARVISAGYDFSVAIKTDGTVWAWGNNSNGQLGHSQLSSELNNGCPTYCGVTPTQVQGVPHP